MNHVTFLAEPALAETSGVRDVNRAVGDLRRGVPVVIDASAESSAQSCLTLAVESAGAASLAEFLTATQGDIVLLLTGARAASLGGKVPPGASADDALLGLKLDRTKPDLALWYAICGASGAVTPAMAALTAVQSDAAQAAIRLAKLAGLLPAVLLADYAGNLDNFLEIPAAYLLGYPAQCAMSLTQVAEATVPLAEIGDARVVAFRPKDGGAEHLAVLIGQPETAQSPLVRVHSACLTGDIFGSRRCDCGPQLHQAMARMAAESAGVLLYLAQEGRGIGLVNKLRAYQLQDGDGGLPGLDTLDANRALGFGGDERDFAAAATMLRALGLARVRLLTNNPDKVAALSAHGIEVASRVSHAIAANGVNDAYLDTKMRRFGHLL